MTLVISFRRIGCSCDQLLPWSGIVTQLKIYRADRRPSESVSQLPTDCGRLWQPRGSNEREMLLAGGNRYCCTLTGSVAAVLK